MYLFINFFTCVGIYQGPEFWKLPVGQPVRLAELMPEHAVDLGKAGTHAGLPASPKPSQDKFYPGRPIWLN